jgi:hypothetical protein
MSALYPTRSTFIFDGGLHPLEISDLDHDDCCICLRPYFSISSWPDPYAHFYQNEDEEYEDDDESVFEEPMQLPCGHVFGSMCILKWTMEKSTCPCCRASLFHHFEDDDTDCEEDGERAFDESNSYVEQHSLSYPWQSWFYGGVGISSPERHHPHEGAGGDDDMVLNVAQADTTARYADEGTSLPESQSVWWDDGVFAHWERVDTAHNGYSFEPYTRSFQTTDGSERGCSSSDSPSPSSFSALEPLVDISAPIPAEPRNQRTHHMSLCSENSKLEMQLEQRIMEADNLFWDLVMLHRSWMTMTELIIRDVTAVFEPLWG